MRYVIRFSQLASEDLTEILGWYQNQGVTGLDKRFIEAMSKTLKSLETSPKAHRIVHENVRQAVLKKFPYKIIYTIEENIVEVLIVAVMHQRRDPNTWQSRT